jgi:hypothetical protein
MNYTEEEIITIVRLREERRNLLRKMIDTPDRKDYVRLDQINSKLYSLTFNFIYL